MMCCRDSLQWTSLYITLALRAHHSEANNMSGPRVSERYLASGQGLSTVVRQVSSADLRLIQDVIRRALADELLFGRLVDGGRVTVDIDDKEVVQLDIQPPRKSDKPRTETVV